MHARILIWDMHCDLEGVAHLSVSIACYCLSRGVLYELQGVEGGGMALMVVRYKDQVV
jgi:hypothetical protein